MRHGGAMLWHCDRNGRPEGYAAYVKALRDPQAALEAARGAVPGANLGAVPEVVLGVSRRQLRRQGGCDATGIPNAMRDVTFVAVDTHFFAGSLLLHYASVYG